MAACEFSNMAEQGRNGEKCGSRAVILARMLQLLCDTGVLEPSRNSPVVKFQHPDKLEVSDMLWCMAIVLQLVDRYTGRSGQHHVHAPRSFLNASKTKISPNCISGSSSYRAVNTLRLL